MKAGRTWCSGLGAPAVTEHRVRLHVSLLAGLLFNGLPEAAAQQLVRDAKRAGKAEVSFAMPACDQYPNGWTLTIRRVRGGHAEEWRSATAANRASGQALQHG